MTPAAPDGASRERSDLVGAGVTSLKSHRMAAHEPSGRGWVGVPDELSIAAAEGTHPRLFTARVASLKSHRMELAGYAQAPSPPATARSVAPAGGLCPQKRPVRA